MTDRIELVVPGPPPTKNTHDRCGCRGRNAFRYNTDRYHAWVSELLMVWNKHGMPRVRRGLWVVEILAVTDRLMSKLGPKDKITAKTRKIDADVPDLDVDAAPSSVLDAMQEIGMLTNDVRIMDGWIRKRYSKANPRVEIVCYPYVGDIEA